MCRPMVLCLVVMVISLVTVRGNLDETIIINSLGRTFTLGMLYDRRSDRIIPGKTLWSPETLAADVDRRDFQSSKYEVQMRDSVKDKLSFMKVEAGLKLSLMGGLVSVEGSSGYLSDFRSSKNVARVSVKYHAETHFEQLTMSHLALSNIEYPAVLDDKEATHIVVGIEYGAEAYFIFEKTVSETEKLSDVQVGMALAVNQIPSTSISIKGDVEMSNEMKEKVKDLHVKFHGDFVTKINPTTFEEAVKIYQELPNYVVGENAQSVPLKVYLYPLNKIDESKIFAIIRDISESLVEELVNIMEDLEDFLEEATELEESIAADHFDVFRQKISRFSNAVGQYKLRFQGVISPLLVEIRGRGKEESELAKILENHTASPFNKDNLENWLKEQRAESAVLKSFLILLDQRVDFSKNIGEYFQHILLNDEVISLIIEYPETTDAVLDNMDKFLDGKDVSDSILFEKGWFRTVSALHAIQRSIEDLLQYKEVNWNSSIKFTCVVSVPDTNISEVPKAEIKTHYFHSRRKHEEVFVPPGPPQNIKQSIDGNAVKLSWNPPSHGSDFIDHYSILVTEKGKRLGQKPIKYVYNTESNQTSFYLAKPDSSVPYDVYVYGVGKVGRTGSSEILHHNGVKVRLVGGAEICSPRKAHSGRIEVLHNYIWGTVCGPITDNEAAVGCRMMGYSHGIEGKSGNDSQGSGQIWMSEVKCNGSESNLDECEFHWAVEGECNHTMDVVVECYGGQPTGNASTPEQCSINELQDQLALSRSNLNLAREELNMERDARQQDLSAMNQTIGRERSSRINTLNSLNSKVTDLSSITDVLKGSVDKFSSVAFHATLSSSATLSAGRYVKFSSVRLNIGNGYNRNTGIFTVPKGGAGLYFIYIHLITEQGQYGRFQLRKDSTVLCYADGDSTNNKGDHDTITCAATVQLREGNKVYVRLDGASTTKPFFGSGRSYHGFTGHLLKPM